MEVHPDDRPYAWAEVDLDAIAHNATTLSDLSSRGVGLNLVHEVKVGDRLSIAAPLGSDTTDLRATIEVRYVHLHPEATGDAGLLPQYWHAGGPFRNMSPHDHERVIRFLFAELRALKR